ncbi:rho GTPase-activating protein 15-like isoform X1 [Ostrinia furnacalis]|uniref:rho GTPase-activating protein 15-like isoform X1 n=1 Tax=Ostrinia furnacalis TaxID=93504 RepID=UPI0010408CEA|nr:rho GTPase-activating protein 15-like isoform X1 [Ostrinia furnacalis]
MDFQNFDVLSITSFFYLYSMVIMSKAKKSPTEKTYAKLKDIFGSHHNLSQKHHDLKVHKPGGSSNEDLSDSTEASIQKSHVRSILRKFFPKRPAMEVLVKKGIYKDEPVFGRKLEEVCPATSPRVPDFVVACVKEIESSEENMCTDGLYRASGNLSQVQKIRLEIDQNNLSVMENNTDIHVLTGSLKLFFRELKEPLIPCSMFDRVLAACSIKPREAKIKEFRDIVQALPQCNRDTLKYLLEHLLRVTQYSERNRMHTANLAIVFGPTLLWAPAEQAHNIAIDCIQQNNVVDILLNDFKEIFTEDNPKGKKKA